MSENPLESILDEWKVDCQIDKLRIDEASRLTPELHHKYLDLLSTAKLKVRHFEFKQKELMKKKWLWYNGKMDQAEIERLGWTPDPYDGLKVLKGDMEHWVEADPDLVASEAKIHLYKTIVETLKDILDHIKWRHSIIKNIIESKKFDAGY